LTRIVRNSTLAALELARQRSLSGRSSRLLSSGGGSLFALGRFAGLERSAVQTELLEALGAIDDSRLALGVVHRQLLGAVAAFEALDVVRLELKLNSLGRVDRLGASAALVAATSKGGEARVGRGSLLLSTSLLGGLELLASITAFRETLAAENLFFKLGRIVHGALFGAFRALEALGMEDSLFEGDGFSIVDGLAASCAGGTATAELADRGASLASVGLRCPLHLALLGNEALAFKVHSAVDLGFILRGIGSFKLFVALGASETLSVVRLLLEEDSFGRVGSL